jgi:PAS domain S-box-containing protein
MRIIEVEGEFDNIVEILQQNGIKNKVIKEDHCTGKTIIAHESIISEKILHMEKQLQKLEETFTELTKRVRGFLKADLPSGKYSLVDKFLKELSGYPIKEWNEKPHFIQSIIHEEYRDTYIDFIKKLQEGIVPRFLEYKIVRKDGEVRWWLQFNLGSFNAKGDLVSVSMIIVDNTENKETELELKRNEEKFRSIIEQSVAGILILKEGKIDFANEVISNYSGYNLNYLQSLESYSFINFVHPEDQQKVLENLKSVESNGKCAEFYVRILTHCKKVKWLSMQFRKMSNLENTIIAVLVEVTKRVNLERKLREERDLSQKYFDAAGALLIVIDTNENVTHINKRGCQILGYTQEEIIGKNWIETFLPERVRGGVRKTFRKAMNGEIQPDDCFINYILTKNGEERKISWHNNMITNKKGSIEAVISSGEVIFDV